MNHVFSSSFCDEGLPCLPFSDYVFPCRLHYTLYPILKRGCSPKSCPWPPLHADPWQPRSLARLRANPMLRTSCSSSPVFYLGSCPSQPAAHWPSSPDMPVATQIPCVQNWSHHRSHKFLPFLFTFWNLNTTTSSVFIWEGWRFS